jgi:hypothetical protein
MFSWAVILMFLILLLIILISALIRLSIFEKGVVVRNSVLRPPLPFTRRLLELSFIDVNIRMLMSRMLVKGFIVLKVGEILYPG